MAGRILVIDDNESVRKAFTLALDGSPYVVETAGGGEEGVKRVTGASFDLIFLDLKMPGMNGVETLREIRKTNESVPVYIVTAFHQEFFDQLQSAQEAGIQFEIAEKPLSSEDILSITKAVLDAPEQY